MKRNFRGLGIYVFIFLIIVFVWRAFGSNGLNTNACTMTEFQQELDSDQVKTIVIRQNEEVPTGNLTIVLNDGSREQMSVSDVKEIESMLKEANFEAGRKCMDSDSPYTVDGRCPDLLYYEHVRTVRWWK